MTWDISSSFHVEQWVLEVLLGAATKNMACGSPTGIIQPVSALLSPSYQLALPVAFLFSEKQSKQSSAEKCSVSTALKDHACTHLISDLWDLGYSICYVKCETISLASITPPLVDSCFCVSIHPQKKKKSPQKTPIYFPLSVIFAGSLELCCLVSRRLKG